MSLQQTSTLLLVRPAAFAFNDETAADNAFQYTDPGVDVFSLASNALMEFDYMADELNNCGLNVIIAEDSYVPPKPDAIFPNNWVFMGHDGRVTLFPMMAPNRRPEKRDEILDLIREEHVITDVLDMSELEAENFFLEGTGSMVMDHENKMIFAALSQRTHPAALDKWARANGYHAITFRSNDGHGHPIYHTNVMMSIGPNIAVICQDAFEDELEWIAVTQVLRSTGHRVVPISIDQMRAFAGNILFVRNNRNESLTLLSETAFDALNEEQKGYISEAGRLVPLTIPTIEMVGGGSVRCMIAEVFLPKK